MRETKAHRETDRQYIEIDREIILSFKSVNKLYTKFQNFFGSLNEISQSLQW